MGKRVRQSIDTLFQGVSRQPDTVRLPGQVEKADNVTFSIVTGGFERRSGTTHIAEITHIGASEDVSVYSYDRDSDEQYFVIIRDGDLHVYDIDGTEATVTFPDGKTYLDSSNPDQDFAYVTIADHTLIANKGTTVALATAGAGSIDGTVQTFNDLPGSPTSGEIYKVTGDDVDNFTGYYVTYDGDVWTETAKPDEQNDFDASTMPHQLVRNGDGTFTFQEATWESREVGDPTLIPDPDFVGRKIKDLVFHQNRLVIIADEVAYYSQPNDFFNFWPDKATDQLDSDPFGRGAPTEDINILQFGVPFRKNLWLTSDKRQFQISALEEFNPRTAVIDPSTKYKASTLAKPISQGDELYFAAEEDQNSVIYEYLFDEDSVSKSATDITKHIRGYIPSNVRQFTGDTTTDTVVLVTEGDRKSVYLYRSWWQNDQKVQSAWARWTFGDDTTEAYVHGVRVFNGALYLIIRRNGKTYIEKALLTDEFDSSDTSMLITNSTTGTQWPIRLDRRESVTGSYNSGNDETTWTVDYEHDDDLVVVKDDDWDTPGEEIGSLSYPTSTTVKASGDLTDHPMVIGKRYESRVELSKLYLRVGQNDRAVTAGRLQLHRIWFAYENTSYFEIHVTLKARSSALEKKFNGRIVGDDSNKLNEIPLVPRGTFNAPIRSKNENATIEIVSDSITPFTIKSALWVGYFNEMTRQDEGF